MLAIFISWIIVSFVFFSMGSCMLLVYGKLIKRTDKYPLIDVFMLGMCFTTVIVSICSFGLAANTNMLLGLVLASTIYSIVRRNSIQEELKSALGAMVPLSKTQKLLLLSPIVILLVHCVTAPLWVDTAYYHLQNLMWNESYSVVPGLANLQPRFGFNSNYYLLCSVFGLKPLFGQYIFGIHQLCIVFVLMWILHTIFKQKSVAKAIVLLIISCVFLIVYKLHITSPTSDLLPNLLILYLFLKVIVDKEALKKYPLLFVAIPAFCMTLKLSSFAVGLFSLILIWNCLKNKKYNELFALVSVGLLIGLPWIGRTIILSGYPIFPFPAIDPFSFDWKVPLINATEQKDFIYAFARVDTMPIEEVLSMPVSEWLPLWWKSGMFYHTAYSNRIFAIFMTMAIPLAAILFSSKKNRVEHRTLLMAWLVALVGVLFWFNSAPDFRFAYGFILTLCFIPVYILLDKYLKNGDKVVKLIIGLSVVALLVMTVGALRWSYYQHDTSLPIADMLYKPQDISYAKKLKVQEHKYPLEFTLVPKGSFLLYEANLESYCYDCPLPCGSDYTGGIEMRGKTFQEGFRSPEGAPYHKGY